MLEFKRIVLVEFKAVHESLRSISNRIDNLVNVNNLKE
jgi:hypothetical protein